MQKVRLEALVRMVADAAILSFSLLVGFITDYTVSVNAGQINAQEVSFLSHVVGYAPTFVLLIIVGLVTFSMTGFYAKGRAYSGRYKALVVTQAVALTF